MIIATTGHKNDIITLFTKMYGWLSHLCQKFCVGLTFRNWTMEPHVDSGIQHDVTMYYLQ